MKRSATLHLSVTVLAVGVSSCLALSAQDKTMKEIFDGTTLAMGFDMGVNTSGGRTNWVMPDGDQGLKMAYPLGQAWGAVFITVGPPTDPPRPSVDLSGFATLLVEIRGDPGTTVEIGIKDSTQPDDGTEAKVIIPVFSNWRSYAIPLDKFDRADLERIYVATEFVFSGPQSQMVWFRGIKYTTALAPSIGAIANGASFAEGTGSGTWTSIFGRDLSETTRGWVGEDFVEDKLPRSLDNVSVNVNEQDMAVAFISPTQVNTLVLQDVPDGQFYFSVTNSVGTSVPLRIVVRPSFPGLFSLPPEDGRYVAAVHLDGVLVGRKDLFGGGVAARPAKPGDVLQLFGTGFGPTDPSGVADELVSVPRPLEDISQTTIRVGGTPAEVLWGGLVLSGLYQFNVTVPTVEDGDHLLEIDLGGQRAAQTVYLTVQR